MRKLNLIILVILIGANVLICGAFFDENIDVEKAVEFYNSIPGLNWKAGRNGFGKTIKLSQIKSKLGLILNPKKPKHGSGISSQDNDKMETDDLPKNYDTRTAYPHCTTISSIKYQSNCGSCWAVAVAAAFSDRLCINSNGKINFNMSADQLLACDENNNGCKGGRLDRAWRYIEGNGLVTGGDYGSNEGCRPYSIPPNPSFFARTAETPTCTTVACPESYGVKIGSIAHTESTEYRIRKEIFHNGPTTTGFMVYYSFNFYEKGIYSKPFIDVPVDNHAVRVIGWGEENGIEYWLVANSWGKDWGEDGTFRIRRGTNECGFEEHMIAGLPAK